MGQICASKPKAKQPQSIFIQQQSSNQNLKIMPYPVSKYSLIQPVPLQIGDVNVISVSEGLAYNFLVKQGVLRQKNNPPDGEAIFLYGGQDTVMPYVSIGLLPIQYGEDNEVLEDVKTARVLFNFKTIWIFKDKDFQEIWIQKLAKKLEQLQVKPKQIIYFDQPLSQLNQQYDILGKEYSILSHFYPLKLFQSQDIILEKTQNNLKDEGLSVFIHGSTQIEKISQFGINLYSSSLKIRNILFMYEMQDIKLVKVLESALYKVDCMKLKEFDGSLSLKEIIQKFIPYINKLKITNSNVLLVHNSSQANTGDLGREVITEFLLREQLIHIGDIEIYMKSRKGIIAQNFTHQKSQMQSKIISQQELPALNRWEEIKIQYQLLIKKNKSKLGAQGVHTTILKLLENSIENPQDQKKRTIQISNKRVQLNILQYVEGIEILKLCGFIPIPSEEPTNYTNNLDIGMIRLIRGDLELAYSRSEDN